MQSKNHPKTKRAIAHVAIVAFLCSALSFLPVTIQSASAQQYTSALGLRLGGTTGLSYKHIGQRRGFEGILGFFNGGFSVTGLVQKHKSIPDLGGFTWFYGVGGHVSVLNTQYGYSTLGRRRDTNATLALGVDGQLGLDYSFGNDFPINLSLDLKPYIEFGSNYSFFSLDPGFSIRYILR